MVNNYILNLNNSLIIEIRWMKYIYYNPYFSNNRLKN